MWDCGERLWSYLGSISPWRSCRSLAEISNSGGVLAVALALAATLDLGAMIAKQAWAVYECIEIWPKENVNDWNVGADLKSYAMRYWWKWFMWYCNAVSQWYPGRSLEACATVTCNVIFGLLLRQIVTDIDTPVPCFISKQEHPCNVPNGCVMFLGRERMCLCVGWDEMICKSCQMLEPGNAGGLLYNCVCSPVWGGTRRGNNRNTPSGMLYTSCLTRRMI